MRGGRKTGKEAGREGGRRGGSDGRRLKEARLPSVLVLALKCRLSRGSDGWALDRAEYFLSGEAWVGGWAGGSPRVHLGRFFCRVFCFFCSFETLTKLICC